MPVGYFVVIVRLLPDLQATQALAFVAVSASCPVYANERRPLADIDIKMPNPIKSVRIDVPPRLISGSGNPITGNRPETIAILTKT